MITKLEVKGIFPVDMLRYDECWPASQDDAYEIAASQMSENDDMGYWTVAIASRKPLTLDRWKSFGCKPAKEGAQ